MVSTTKMAKSWSVREGLCVIFLVFLTVSSVLSNSDYYSYQTNSADDSSVISLNLQNGAHTIHKRRSPTTTEENSNSTTNVPGNQQQQQATSATSVASIPSTLSPTVPQNVSDLLGKNLGENGAGIRKNVSEPKPTPTARPILQIQSTNISTSILQKKLLDNSTVARNNQTGGDDDLISIAKFSEIESDFNKTLAQHNITVMNNDTHKYYNSTFIINPQIGKQYWISLDTNNRNVTVNDILSTAHRRATTVKLSFDFPFYGHYVRNVTIATGGFLYTGDYIHAWLAATQYIAPLMANFDPGLSNNSYIKYVDNGTAFTVLWEKVILKDKPTEGEFTFQATLHSNGDIVFVYQNVPQVIENIEENIHPVKVGLSDAYVIDKTVFFVRRKTIFEYHRVNFRQEDIKNWTVIYLKALPTCLSGKDCASCFSQASEFDCSWCPILNRCSNGMDRMRQEWLAKGCDKQSVNASSCDKSQQVRHNTSPDITYDHDKETDASFEDTAQASHDGSALRSADSGRMSVSGVVTILFLIALVAGIGIWVLYAYRNPHSSSGQFFIRYRPSQWSWRRGEARYTAATIHM